MKKKQTSEKGKAWLQREMRPYRASIAFITILYALATLASLAFAYLVQFLVRGAQDKNETAIITVASILLAVLFVKIIAQVFYGYQSEKLRSKMTSAQRSNVYGKILRGNYATVSGYHSGDLLNRITSDVTEVVTDTVGLTPTLCGMAIQCVGAVFALLTLDPVFTTIYVICGAFGGAVMALFRKKVKTYHKEFMQVDGEARSFMQESLSSLLTVKAYKAEEKAVDQLECYSSKYYSARMKRNILRTLMSALTSILSNVGLIFAVIWCSVALLNGSMEFGMMLSVVLLLNQLQHPFSAISGVIPVIFSRQASAERLHEITSICENTISTVNSSSDAIDGFLFIDFDNVSFDYGREEVLKNVSLSVKSNETICFVGNSGSGKSTLFKLLLGVYTPKSGKIILTDSAGNCIEDANAFNNLFAYVPQGNFLFSGTIRENLLYFSNGDVSDAQLKDAIKTAQADFIFDLPNGLDTILSERGSGLSEGQQQRLTIARALLSNRPILLLDEATSALDSETERQLLQAIQALDGKTCILVTHRPAALSIANRVYRLLDGEMTQEK